MKDVGYSRRHVRVPAHPRRRRWMILPHRPRDLLAHRLREAVVGAQQRQARHRARYERKRVAEKGEDEAQDE